MEPDETLSVAVVADTGDFERSMRDLTRRAESFAATMTGAFAKAASGGRTLDQVFQGLARRLSTLALDAALKPLENLLSGALGSVLGGSASAGTGGAGAGAARVVPFAKGGVVAAPSYFPMGGSLGLMGEAGAEAILPLRRGPDGALGVAATQRAGPTTIVFNVSTPDVEGFRRSRGQIETMLARSASRGRRGL